MRSTTIRNLIFGLTLLLLWGIIGLLVQDVWFSSWNGISHSFYMPLMYVGSIIAAFSGWYEGRSLKHHQDPVWLSTPRSWFTIRTQELISRYFYSILLPLLTIQLLLFALGFILNLNGYIDFRYIALAHAVALSNFLLGVIVAHLYLPTALTVSLSLFLGLYNGMYLILTESDIDTWEILNPRVWIPLGAYLTVAILSIIIFYSTRTLPISLSRLFSCISILVTVYIVLSLGSVPVSGYERKDVHNINCYSIDKDQLCLWKEDNAKIPALSAQIKRIRALSDYAHLNLPPTTFHEPAIPPEQVPPLEKSESFATIIPDGGDTNPWRTSSDMAFFLLRPFSIQCAQKNTNHDSFALADIIANYAYGDITYAGFATSDQEGDRGREKITQELKSLSQDELLVLLGKALDRYRTHCAFTNQDLLTHV